MTKNERPIIKMNGNKLKEKQAKPFKLNQIDHTSEQAATVEKSEHNPEPLNNKQATSLIAHKKNFAGKIEKNKKMILTIFIAMVVGSILGFTMLGIFGSIDNGMTSPSDSPSITVGQDSKETTKTKSDTFTSENINAYILQGGVFEDKDNAKEFLGKFQSSGFPAMIWQRGDKYTVIAGIGSTFDSAKQLAVKIEEDQLDVFVKEWETPSSSVKLTKKETKWFKSFEQLLAESVDQIDEPSSIAKKEWTDLVESAPGKSKEIAILIDNIQPQLEKFNNQEKVSIALTVIWKEYEEFLNKFN